MHQNGISHLHGLVVLSTVQAALRWLHLQLRRENLLAAFLDQVQAVRCLSLTRLSVMVMPTLVEPDHICAAGDS